MQMHRNRRLLGSWLIWRYRCVADRSSEWGALMRCCCGAAAAGDGKKAGKVVFGSGNRLTAKKVSVPLSDPGSRRLVMPPRRNHALGRCIELAVPLTNMQQLSRQHNPYRSQREGAIEFVSQDLIKARSLQDKPPAKPREDPKPDDGPKFSAFGGKPNKLR